MSKMKQEEIFHFLELIKQDVVGCERAVRQENDVDFTDSLGRIVDLSLMLLSETDKGGRE